MVPRVRRASRPEDIVSQLKYAPQGKRGVALGIAHDLYRAGDAEFFARANEEIAVILLLETEKAFENLDEIVSVPESMSRGWGITISLFRWAFRRSLSMPKVP